MTKLTPGYENFWGKFSGKFSGKLSLIKIWIRERLFAL